MLAYYPLILSVTGLSHTSGLLPTESNRWLITHQTPWFYWLIAHRSACRIGFLNEIMRVACDTPFAGLLHTLWWLIAHPSFCKHL